VLRFQTVARAEVVPYVDGSVRRKAKITKRRKVWRLSENLIEPRGALNEAFGPSRVGI